MYWTIITLFVHKVLMIVAYFVNAIHYKDNLVDLLELFDEYLIAFKLLWLNCYFGPMLEAFVAKINCGVQP